MRVRGPTLIEQQHAAQKAAANGGSFDFESKLEDLRRTRRLRRMRRTGFIASSIILVPLLAVGVFLTTQRNHTTVVSLDEVAKQFRAKRLGTPDPLTSAIDPSTAAPAAVDESAPAPADDPAAPAPVVAPKPAQRAPAGGYALPPEGVYTYRATGGEKVSLFGAGHSYPSQYYATVRHTGGCGWEHTNNVIAEHVDRRIFCSEPGKVSQLQNERRITFFGKTEGATAQCKPGVVFHRTTDKVNATDRGICIDENANEIRLERTFIKQEPYKIDGKTVDAIHIRVDATFSGNNVGTSVDDMWLAADTGMTMRWDRTVDTVSSAFGAKVNYNEDASFVLQSLKPQT